jgi:hypothetical protein
MKKSSNIAVVNNNDTVPAPAPAPDYADFDDFRARARFIGRDWKVLNDTNEALELALEKYEQHNVWEDLQKGLDAVARCGVGANIKAEFIRWEAARTQIFDPDSLYDTIMRDGHERTRLKRRVVEDQVALLIGSFPNGQPHTPAIYSAMLITEILATDPSAIDLEAACRTIRRTKSFLPSIKEALEVLAQMEEEWPVMPDEADDFDWAVGEIKEKIADIRTKLKADKRYQALQEQKRAQEEAAAKCVTVRHMRSE